MADESAAEFDVPDENEVRYRLKCKAMHEAVKKVESILGVYVEKTKFDDAVWLYKTKELAELPGWNEDRERARLGIGIHFNSDGGTYVPDAFAPDVKDDPWTCEPAPWKAAVLAELQVLLTLDQTEQEYFNYAISVFGGEVLHPAVLADIR